ncbi:hypothetical protein [Clostridium saccharoperbutylacetonicum]
MIQKHKLISDDDYKMAISSKEKSLRLWIDGGYCAFGEDGKMYRDWLLQMDGVLMELEF